MTSRCPDADRTKAAADLLIINKRGLHARASSRFVKCVDGFDASVTVSKDDITVSGTSIMGLMLLGAAPGSTIHVTASGAQAADAIQALQALIQDRFGETE